MSGALRQYSSVCSNEGGRDGRRDGSWLTRHTRCMLPHTLPRHLLPPRTRRGCYRHLIGRECEVPMSGGRRIPIIGDEYVDREFGTGALKITPGRIGASVLSLV